jgi:hypothetical protein
VGVVQPPRPSGKRRVRRADALLTGDHRDRSDLGTAPTHRLMKATGAVRACACADRPSTPRVTPRGLIFPSYPMKFSLIFIIM